MTAPRAWLALVLLLCCPALRAGENVDAQGDPLPPGAVARLGSTRGWHPREVSSLVFSPDGKTIACACLDGAVRLWEAATLKPVGEIKAGDEASQVVWLPSGKEIVVRLFGGEVKCLPVGGGRPLWTLPLGQGDDVALSPDGKLLAAGRAKGRLEIFDTTTRKSVKVLTHGQDRIIEVAFSPDGKRLAAATTHNIAVWDVASGARLHASPSGDLLGNPELAFTADGKHLLLAGLTRDPMGTRISRWTIGKEKPVLGPTFPFTNTLLGPDGRWFLGGDEHQKREVWSADAATRPVPLEGGEDHVRHWALSPDNETIAGVNDEGHLLLWSRRTGARLLPRSGHIRRVSSLGISHDGKTILTGDRWTTDIRVWDAKDGRLSGTLPLSDTPTGDLLLTADGRRAVVSSGSELHALDLNTRKVKTIPTDITFWLSLLPGDAGVLFGRRTTDGGHALCTWDWNDQSGPAREFPPTEEVLSPDWTPQVILSPDGRWLASWDGREALAIKDARSGRQTLRFRSDHSITQAHFSPDSRLLAVLTPDGVVPIFEAASGLRRHELKGNGDFLRAAWTPDGRSLILGDNGGALAVADVLTGRVAPYLDTHSGWIGALALSGNGKTLATAGDDGTVLLWPTPAMKPEPGGVLTARELDAAWANLNGDDGARVSRALAALAADPAQAVPFLEKHLTPAATLSPADVKRLFAELDAHHFATRQKASAQLASLGKGIEPALAELRRGTPSAEVRSRVDHLLEELAPKPAEAEACRQARAVEALERAGTPEARKLLESLAQQPEWTPLSREARAALGRLQRQQ